MFPIINHISDLKPKVADKKEIKFFTQPNGVTIACYMFSDSTTFDSPEALECRGIAFDKEGKVCSRPFHKFFNIGEKQTLDDIKDRNDLEAIYEKIDGSMIATAWVDGKLEWRSKRSFTSDVVKLAKEFLAKPENIKISMWATAGAENGYTSIFELTHPDARIVVNHKEPALTLLAVRKNDTGAYLPLDYATCYCPTIPRVEGSDRTIDEIIELLADMKDEEGYVIVAEGGERWKLKCPWYVRLHRSITFLRERDIALLSLHEELDDVKANLVEAGIDLMQVNEVEAKVKKELLFYTDMIESIYNAGKDMSRKDFALANCKFPAFGLIMDRYLGKEVQLNDWYERNKCKEVFGLRFLTDSTRSEEIS